jgi:hypothetical protein
MQRVPGIPAPRLPAVSPESGSTTAACAHQRSLANRTVEASIDASVATTNPRAGMCRMKSPAQWIAMPAMPMLPPRKNAVRLLPLSPRSPIPRSTYFRDSRIPPPRGPGLPIRKASTDRAVVRQRVEVLVVRVSRICLDGMVPVLRETDVVVTWPNPSPGVVLPHRPRPGFHSGVRFPLSAVPSASLARSADGPSCSHSRKRPFQRPPRPAPTNAGIRICRRRMSSHTKNVIRTLPPASQPPRDIVTARPAAIMAAAYP